MKMRNFLLILVAIIPKVRLQPEPRPPYDIPEGRRYPITADNLLHDFPPERSPEYLVDGPPPFIRRRGRRRHSYQMSPPFDTYPSPPMLERHPVRPTRPPYVRRRIIDPYYEEIRPYDRVAFQPIFRDGLRRRLPPRYRPGVENYPHINGEFGPIVHDRRDLPYRPRSPSRRLPPDFMDYRSREFTRRPRRERFLSSGRKDRIFREQRRGRRGDARPNGIGFHRQTDYMKNKIDPSRKTFIDIGFSEGSQYSGNGYRHQDYDFTSDYNTPRRSQLRPPGGDLNRLIIRNDNLPPDLPMRDPTSKRRRLYPFSDTDPIDRRNSLTRQQATFSRTTDFVDHPTHVRSSHSSSNSILKRPKRSPLSPGRKINAETRNSITSIQDGFISESVNEKPASTSDKIISKSTSVNIESSTNGISKKSTVNKTNTSQKNTGKQYVTTLINNNELQEQNFDIHNVLTTPVDKTFNTKGPKKRRNIGSANTFIKTTPLSITIPVPVGFNLSKSSNMVVDLTKSISENNQGQQKQFESHLSPDKVISAKIPKSSRNGPTDLRRAQLERRKGREHIQNGSLKKHTRRRGQRRYRGSAASNNRQASSRPRPREPHREKVIPRRVESSSSSTMQRNTLLHDKSTRMDRPGQRSGRYLSNSERSKRQDRVSKQSQRPIHSSRRLHSDGPPGSRGQRRRISSTVDKISRRRLAPSQRPYRISSSRTMGTESRDRPNIRRRFRQYTNDSSVERSLDGSSDSTSLKRRPLLSRTYPNANSTDNLSTEFGLSVPRRIPPQSTSLDRTAYDSLDERSRAIDFFQERQLSPRRTRTDRQTIRPRRRRPPEDASPRRRLSSAERVPTGRSSDIEVQRQRRLPTRRRQEYAPPERSRGSPLLESSLPDILPSPRTQYRDEPIVYPNRSSQVTDEIPVSPPYDIPPERSIRGYRRSLAGIRSRDESFIGLPSERRLLPAPVGLYSDEISEIPIPDRQGFRRDRIRSPRRPYSRLRRRPPVLRERYLDENVLVPRREARRDIPSTRRELLSSERTTGPYTDETFVAPPGRRFADDLTTDYPPYRLPPARRSSLEESSVARSLERSGVSRTPPSRVSSIGRDFTNLSVDQTPERNLRLEAPRRRPRRLRESGETSRGSYPARTTGALRFRSFSSRDQYANESSISPYPSVDLLQRRIASSERRPLSTRRYAIEPQVTESSASLPERRRIRVKSRRPRRLRYRVRVPRREVTSHPPKRRRLPPRSASRRGPVLLPLEQKETLSITAPFRKVAQVSLSVNETSSMPRVPTTERINRNGLPSVDRSEPFPRRRPLLEQQSGDRRIPEVRRQPISYKPSVSQQVSVPSRYNDTVAGVRLGFVRARGGENGFPIHGGFCPGEECADGGLAAGVANGTGTGTLDKFLERKRTGANEDIIAYKREIGPLTIT